MPGSGPGFQQGTRADTHTDDGLVLRREGGTVKRKPGTGGTTGGGLRNSWGCQGGAGREPPWRVPGYFTDFSSSLPALKRATRLALIWMASPVCGLRPVRALRLEV